MFLLVSCSCWRHRRRPCWWHRGRPAPTRRWCGCGARTRPEQVGAESWCRSAMKTAGRVPNSRSNSRRSGPRARTAPVQTVISLTRRGSGKKRADGGFRDNPWPGACRHVRGISALLGIFSDHSRVMAKAWFLWMLDPDPIPWRGRKLWLRSSEHSSPAADETLRVASLWPGPASAWWWRWGSGAAVQRQIYVFTVSWEECWSPAR